MPNFHVEVPHAAGKEAATEKLKGFLDKVAKEYGDQVSHLDGQWNDNVLTFALTTYGFKISGTLQVEETVAVLDGQLPIAAMMFKGRIEQSIRQELERELS